MDQTTVGKHNAGPTNPAPRRPSRQLQLSLPLPLPFPLPPRFPCLLPRTLPSPVPPHAPPRWPHRQLRSPRSLVAPATILGATPSITKMQAAGALAGHAPCDCPHPRRRPDPQPDPYRRCSRGPDTRPVCAPYARLPHRPCLLSQLGPWAEHVPYTLSCIGAHGRQA